MEHLYEQGRVRAIGVSNFTVQTLDRLLRETTIIPAVNQIELHPWLVGQGGELLDEPVLAGIGARYSKTPAQVVSRWHLQLGNIVIPKSVTPARMRENIDVFNFVLDDEDLAAISALDRGRRLGPDPATFS